MRTETKFQTYCPRCGMYCEVRKVETDKEFLFWTQCDKCDFKMQNTLNKEEAQE